jgi:large subunit ribosomal protein L25
MSNIQDVFKAEARSPNSKGAARKLRAAGRLPAVVYGQKQEPLHISVSTKDFVEGRQRFGRTHLYHVDVEGGQKIPVLIKDIQVDRFRRDVQHIDFWAVDMSKDVTLRTDLEMVGRPQGVVKGGKFRQLRRNVDLVGRPGTIPNKLVIDITSLDAGESIRLENLDLPEGVKPAAEDNHAVCMVAAPKRGQLEQQAKKEAAGK